MKKIIALGIVVALVVLAYGGVWLWAAGQVTAHVQALATADGETTPRLACESLGVGGFPFSFDVTCTNATIESGDVTVTVAGLKATAEVYRPTHVLAFAQAPVRISDAFTGSSSRIDFDSLAASARLEGWRIARVSLVAEAPVLTDTVLDDWVIAKASRAEAHLVDEPDRHDAGLGLATLAQYLKLEGLEAPVWSITGGTATAEAEITNVPDDVRSYGDADLLRRWQAAGGRYLLTSLTGSDAAGAFDVTGTLGLDSTGRAEGQVHLHSTGMVERLGPLLPPEYKGWIVGTQAADGSYSQALNIRAGVVFAGLLPVGVIPPLF